jgi:GNAT superfamily N-acetyltransferase
MKLLPLHKLSSTGLSYVKDIYDEAFPAWEREDFDELLGRGADHDIKQYACVVDEAILGLATLSSLRSIGWDFLEYFALAQDCRGRGIGSQFWSHINAQVASPVVLEVEHPEQSGLTTADVTIRQARIRFWNRAGFNELPVPNYLVPRADDENNEVFEPLILMSNVPPIHPLCSAVALTAALYAEGYGLSDADERAVASQRATGNILGAASKNVSSCET